MTSILVRLAFAGIRSRVLASGLTVVLTTAVAATIVLALEVGATSADPWMRTFEAAHGAHVLANVPSEAAARTVASLPGVVEADDPVPIATATMFVGGREVTVFVSGLAGPARIDAPVLTEGTEVIDGGIVLERSLARALDVSIGTVIGFPTAAGTLDLVTVGTAVSPAQPRYPRSTPGLVWVTRAMLERVEPDRARWRWTEAVRLADPSAAPRFAENAAAAFPPGSVAIASWQEQRALALQEAQPVQVILSAYGLLMLIVSVAVMAILIGARASGQYREIGLLRAIGLTPRQVSAVFAIEVAALGFVGIVVGFGVGALLAPRLAAPTAAALLASPTMATNPWHVLVAGVVILPVIVGSAYAAARRYAASTAVQAIRAGVPAPASRSRLARTIAASMLPIPMMIGLRDLLARRRRAVWLLLATFVTSAALVVTLVVRAVLDARPAGEPSDVPDELPVLIFTLDAVLATITFTALVAVTLLSVRERVRDLGVLRAIGLTPAQVTWSVVGAHEVLALAASLASIPAGIGLYLVLFLIASGEGASLADVVPWWWLAAAPVSMLLATGFATGLPARFAARISAADAVRYE